MNLGVKEVVCRTILENKLSIIGLQEIIEPEAVMSICNELNEPTLPRIIEWNDNPKCWKFVLNSTCANKRFYHLNGLAFIYNGMECEYLEMESMDLLFEQFIIDSSSRMEREIIMPSGLLGAFKIGNWTIRILNIYLRYCNMLQLDKLIETILDDLNLRTKDSQNLQINDIFAVIGDFSSISYAEEKLKELTKFNIFEEDDCEIVDGNWYEQALKDYGFYNMISPQSSNAHPIANSKRTSSCNILCREPLPILNGSGYFSQGGQLPMNNDKRLTGRCGVIRDGITHMAIPNKWTWGGYASQHCPVWVEVRKPYVPNNINVISKSHSSIGSKSNGITKRDSIGNGVTNGNYQPINTIKSSL